MASAARCKTCPISSSAAKSQGNERPVPTSSRSISALVAARIFFKRVSPVFSSSSTRRPATSGIVALRPLSGFDRVFSQSARRWLGAASRISDLVRVDLKFEHRVGLKLASTPPYSPIGLAIVRVLCHVSGQFPVNDARVAMLAASRPRLSEGEPTATRN